MGVAGGVRDLLRFYEPRGPEGVLFSFALGGRAGSVARAPTTVTMLRDAYRSVIVDEV